MGGYVILLRWVADTRSGAPVTKIEISRDGVARGHSEPTSVSPGLRRAVATGVGILAISLSVWSARGVVARALRSVPSLDLAFRALGPMTSSVGHDAAIVTSVSDFARREWMAYFLGENLLAHLPDGEVLPPDLLGRKVFRLGDLRDEGSALVTTLHRANAFFALVREPS